jgi:hypothetical protein
MVCQMRAFFYFQQVISTEEGILKDHGAVIVQYNLGPYGFVMGWDEAEAVADQMFDGAAFNMAAGHFCCDDPKQDAYVAALSLFGDQCDRSRWRHQFGETKSEVLFTLQTYGIPTEKLPINDEQTLELGWRRQWLESQRKRESNISVQNCLVPRRFDVLFGRGSHTRVHTGNLRALHLVEMQCEEYEEASKNEKTAIAARIVTKILESYGRFLKWEEEGWVEVDFDTARNKVSHFFRRRRLQEKDPPDDAFKWCSDVPPLR